MIEKIQKFMEDKILPVATAIASQRHLAALRDGMTVLIPLSIIGGLSLVIAVPPIPADTTNSFLLAIRDIAAQFKPIFMSIYWLTIGLTSVYVVAGIAYQLAKKYQLNTLTNLTASLLVFLLIAANPDGTTLQASGLGASSMFAGIIVTFIVVEINRFCVKNNITIKLPAAVPPNVAAPFTILIPTVINVFLFVTINSLLVKYTGSGITSLVYTVLQPLLRAGDGLPFIMTMCILSIIFWFFGIHGGNMIGVVTSSITTLNLAANAEAYAAGLPLPKIYVGFFAAIFGDQLAHIALIIAILFICKSARLKSIAKIGSAPAIFQITEPLTFGIPTVLNVLTVIPIILCTCLNLTTAYMLMNAGLVGKFFVSLPFTVPGPLYAFLATMDIKATILWFVLLPLNVLIMIPFIRTYDKQVLAEEATTVTE